MKTPEQIAREALGADAFNRVKYGINLLPHMVQAIEADRAQRAYWEKNEHG